MTNIKRKKTVQLCLSEVYIFAFIKQFLTNQSKNLTIRCEFKKIRGYRPIYKELPFSFYLILIIYLEFSYGILKRQTFYFYSCICYPEFIRHLFMFPFAYQGLQFINIHAFLSNKTSTFLCSHLICLPSVYVDILL